MSQKIITLTTDFGLQDAYVAAMKGVILSISPACSIIDITHEVEPQQILPATFALQSAYLYFPPGTVHVAVVDPGVGSDRAIIGVKAAGQYFIAPDNGLLGFLFSSEADVEVRKVVNEDLYLPQVSRTFHGRDIMSPVGAHLLEGVSFDDLGPLFDDYIKTSLPPIKRKEHRVIGQIVYRDRFGNLITNITADDLAAFGDQPLALQTGYTSLRGLKRSYSEVAKGDLLFLISSNGFLEIALREGSAADKLRFPIGTDVEISSEE